MKTKLNNILTLLVLIISLNVFSQKSIISTNKVGQAKDGELCFVKREIVRFNQSNAQKLTAIVNEKFYIKEAVLDSLGVDTGVEQLVLKEDKGRTSTDFPNEVVDNLFFTLSTDIKYTDSFIDSFNSLQQKALLLYTMQINRYGTTQWEILTE